jgi:type I restriction enzyme, S subunit
MPYSTKKLGEVADIYQPQTITSNEILKEGPFKVFGANGVIGYYSKYNHEDAEVLVTCRGATCGTLNMSEPKSWITGNAMVVHPKDERVLSKDFLYYTLKNSNLLRTITGTGQPQITRNSLSPFEISLPPLEIQKQIVERLDKIVEAQKLNDDLIQKSDELFQSLLHKELNPTGKDWSTKKLGEAAEVITSVARGYHFFKEKPSLEKFIPPQLNIARLQVVLLKQTIF